MKYFYFITIIFLISLFFLFAIINPEIIDLDLFFLKVEGVTVGFTLVFCILIGAIVSFILQLPRLLRRQSKVSSVKKDENP